MKLTNFIRDVGRVVAYYPKLKKVTGSTVATILLCQFIYWIGKTNDGWIYKTSEEIEEETGLTYNEQRTARKKLIAVNLLEEHVKHLDHTTAYRIDEDRLNDLWIEAVRGNLDNSVEPIEEDSKPVPVPASVPQKPIEPKKTHIEKKGDLVDAMREFNDPNTPANIKSRELIAIHDLIKKRLNINPSNNKWNKFINFAWEREKKHGESVKTFIDWALANGFSAVYWTAEKMETIWPQAFAKPETGVAREDFVKPLPKQAEVEYAPMPSHLGRKREE